MTSTIVAVIVCCALWSVGESHHNALLEGRDALIVDPFSLIGYASFALPLRNVTQAWITLRISSSMSLPLSECILNRHTLLVECRTMTTFAMAFHDGSTYHDQLCCGEPSVVFTPNMSSTNIVGLSLPFRFDPFDCVTTFFASVLAGSVVVPMIVLEVASTVVVSQQLNFVAQVDVGTLAFVPLDFTSSQNPSPQRVVDQIPLGHFTGFMSALAVYGELDTDEGDLLSGFQVSIDVLGPTNQYMSVLIEGVWRNGTTTVLFSSATVDQSTCVVLPLGWIDPLREVTIGGGWSNTSGKSPGGDGPAVNYAPITRSVENASNTSQRVSCLQFGLQSVFSQFASMFQASSPVVEVQFLKLFVPRNDTMLLFVQQERRSSGNNGSNSIVTLELTRNDSAVGSAAHTDGFLVGAKFCGNYAGTPALEFRLQRIDHFDNVTSTVVMDVLISSNGYSKSCNAVHFGIVDATESSVFFNAHRNNTGGQCFHSAVGTVGRSPWIEVLFDRSIASFWVTISLGAFHMLRC